MHSEMHETGAEQAAEVVDAAVPAVVPVVLPPLAGTGADQPPAEIDRVLDVPLQLTAEMGRKRLQMKDVLNLAVGSIVELETVAGEPMDVLVNGFLIAQGEVVVVNDRFGIRLTDVVSPSQRLRRLHHG